MYGKIGKISVESNLNALIPLEGVLRNSSVSFSFKPLSQGVLAQISLQNRKWTIEVLYVLRKFDRASEEIISVEE